MQAHASLSQQHRQLGWLAASLLGSILAGTACEPPVEAPRQGPAPQFTLTADQTHRGGGRAARAGYDADTEGRAGQLNLGKPVPFR